MPENITHHQAVDGEKRATASTYMELKKEALVYFGKWQAGVLQRLREVKVSYADNGAQRSRGRGRRLRPGSRAGRSGQGGRGCLMPSTLATEPKRAPTVHVDPELASRYPPIANALWTLHLDRRKLLLHIALLILVSLQEYSANSRLLLVSLASSLNLPFKEYEKDEMRLAIALAETVLEEPAEEEATPKLDDVKGSRKWKPGLGGASSTPAPAFLAAPLQNAGIGTSRGGLGLTTSAAAGLLGIMAENGALMGSLFGMNPTRPLSKSLENILKEVQDFAFIRLAFRGPYEYVDPRGSPAEDRRLRVVVAMSGFLLQEDDMTRNWRGLSSQTEAYAVRWETAALLNFGHALETLIKTKAWKKTRKSIASKTTPRGSVNSSWPAPILRVSKIIDNSWSVGFVRAEKAGANLADSLTKQRFQGDRPVSLIGFSLAARTIYNCLMSLAERRQFGLVDSVVMLGTPAPADSGVWKTLKSVVSGRLINVYCENDCILGFLSRTSNTELGLAGLQEIRGANGVENHCVKSLPKGHLSYSSLLGHILRDVGWEDLDAGALGLERLAA
ncbi:uncharacterized protein UV8b_08089 [Ustilaginoidea virens]|uniref:DUF726 domain-containing protein n=1 Tax=Ustilaginoidea virens TaxID=1159556 RepID=A0A8E5HYG6_USTVR|nr:uncharacterized protein UV8b_08089 [Ustilaginoidea virens]QUC23848.1 hypothetical protein UV8b_08089 [Ustilaginoidea virens]